MKRRLFTILAFLLLAAIVNVAVAWGCTIFAPETSTLLSGENAESILHRHVSFDPSKYDFTSIDGRRLRAIGWREDAVSLHEMDFIEGYRATVLFVTDAGWPCIALRDAWAHGAHGFEGKGLPIPSAWRSPNTYRFLPSGVLWPGFALNTVFYAVILSGLFAAPFALRRRIRIRRGLCPACAYPVGDSPVCTECGKALVEQKAASA